MKWLTFSALVALISLVGSTLAQAQDDLPALDLPTASSATALNGLQARQLSTDFDFLFLPAGAGGEQSTAERNQGHQSAKGQPFHYYYHQPS